MKRCIAFLVIFLSAKYSLSQNLNFSGLAPSLSFSLPSGKTVFNILVVSKTRIGDHEVKGVNYDQQILEIYSQLSASCFISNHVQLTAGYGFQRNNPFLNNWRNESRLLQQVLFVIPFYKNKLLQRFRFEERWFSYPAAKNEFGTRARYQLGYVKQLKGRMFYWHINDEIYAITSGSRNAFISENWIYTGLGFALHPFGNVETGIGYNSIVRNNNHDLNSLFLLQLNWSYSIKSKHAMDMHPVMQARRF